MYGGQDRQRFSLPVSFRHAHMAPGRRSSERRFYFFMPSSGRGGGQEQRLPDRIRILSGTRRKEGVGVRESFSDYCRRTGQEGLLDQWFAEAQEKAESMGI